MKQWITYYVLSFLIIAVIEVIPVFLALEFVDSLGIILSVLIFLSKYVIVFVIVVLQIVILYLNKTRESVRLKFFIAFSCLYSLILAAAYVLHVQLQSRVQDALDVDDSVELNSYNNNAFLGQYTLFIIPMILQMVIFILLYQKKKRTISETIS